MRLLNLQVNHGQPYSDFVEMYALDNRPIVLAVIPTIHLEDHLQRSSLTGQQANIVVDANQNAFSRIISAKYEHGKWRDFNWHGSTVRRVDIGLADIEASGETISDSVLAMATQYGFVNKDGRISKF